MIELIYNEEGELSSEKRELWEPKNVRQIGETEENRKIFIEDYVHIFLQQYGGAESGANGKIAVLLGNCERAGGRKYLYIKGALAVETAVQKDGKYEFSEKLWDVIYKECEAYFKGQDIVGWFLARPGFPLESSRMIEETQKTYFPGADKVLMLFEPLEGETAFFAFEQNRFERRNGYFIYYERNEPMRFYMLETGGEREKTEKPEKTERAVASFRKILQEKKEVNVKRKKQAAAYAVRAGAAVLLLAGALVVLEKQNSSPQQKMEEVSALQGGEEKPLEEKVVIEELPGNVGEQLTDTSGREQPPEEIPVTDGEDVQEEAASGEPPAEPPAETAAEEPLAEQPPEEAGTAEEAVSEQPVYEEYVVKRGDTLAGISREKYGDAFKVPEICELNGITDGDYIQEGEIILLP